MINHSYCFGLLVMIFIACQSPEKKIYRLTDDQLVNLMFDMHLADALLTEFPKRHQDSIKVIYMKRMSEAYSLSEEEIQEEIDKLTSEPEKMKLVLGLVKVLADSLQ